MGGGLCLRICDFHHGSLIRIRQILAKIPSEMVALVVRICDGMEQTGSESEDTSQE